ncbi:hypothetical protein [Roseateles microcysteis]|uniref:hypothetical protein n=1 Tax=Roseateles microcysteis TaxID=3119057 RepID=UPI002FE50117
MKYMRTLLVLAASMLSSAALFADSFTVRLYDSCKHQNDYFERGVRVAQHQIREGKLHVNVYYEYAPLPATLTQLEEAKARVQVLRNHGIEAELKSSGSDMVDCIWTPYWSAYDQEMKKAIDAKFGAQFWTKVDREVKKRQRRH